MENSLSAAHSPRFELSWEMSDNEINGLQALRLGGKEKLLACASQNFIG